MAQQTSQPFAQSAMQPPPAARARELNDEDTKFLRNIIHACEHDVPIDPKTLNQIYSKHQAMTYIISLMNQPFAGQGRSARKLIAKYFRPRPDFDDRYGGMFWPELQRYLEAQQAYQEQQQQQQQQQQAYQQQQFLPPASMAWNPAQPFAFPIVPHPQQQSAHGNSSDAPASTPASQHQQPISNEILRRNRNRNRHNNTHSRNGIVGFQSSGVHIFGDVYSSDGKLKRRRSSSSARDDRRDDRRHGGRKDRSGRRGRHSRRVYDSPSDDEEDVSMSGSRSRSRSSERRERRSQRRHKRDSSISSSRSRSPRRRSSGRRRRSDRY